MNHTFVIGMERCGTHSIANILVRSCLVPSYIRHEMPPYLCYEASQVVAGGDWHTPELENRIKMYRINGEKLKFVCEANHRLGFVAKYLNDQFPDAKFILMVRDPIKTLVSRVATLAHWPVILDRYPDFYQDKIKRLVPIGKEAFNMYRPVPPDLNAPLYEMYLWEWVETYRITKEQIKDFKNLLILETKTIASSVNELLEFVGKDMFDLSIAKIEAKKRKDSVYENGEKDAIAYAWDMFEPHIDEIKSYIRQQFPGDPIIEKITT